MCVAGSSYVNKSMKLAGRLLLIVHADFGSLHLGEWIVSPLASGSSRIWSVNIEQSPLPGRRLLGIVLPFLDITR
jgi:hypothetical protein